MSIDALVIGGGPAGLMAAIYLARFRRSVTLVDADQSRLAKLPRTHNYPGFADGIVGPQLLLNLRQQASRYAIQFEAGTVDQLERAGSDFRVAWPGGAARTRCVLLARGAVDVEPTMLHLAGALRDGAIRYCPVCDGFEVIDQALGVIADGPKGSRRHCIYGLSLTA